MMTRLTDNELLAIFDREVRRECEWTRMRREVLPAVVRYTEEGRPDGGGFISWAGLTTDVADGEIERQMAHFQALGMELEWKLYTHDQPADLGERLNRHGFKPGQPGALMVMDIRDLRDDFWQMDITKVFRVTTSEGVDAIIQMENEVWGKDLARVGEGLKNDMRETPDLLSVFAIWDGGRVVSAAWTFYLKPTSFASLWGGSTLKEYRKQGLYRSLLVARALEARERGYRFLQVDASPDSQPILAKNGFRCLGYSTPYEWKPGDDS